MTIQLDDRSLGEVRDILARHVPQVKAWAFGSRASGRAKKFSDLDLVLEGEAPLDGRMLARLHHAFVESDLPIKVDVVDWHALDPEFRALIDRQRVPL